jgi:hypothetical protein
MKNLMFYSRGSDGIYRRRVVFPDGVEIIHRDAHGRLIGVQRLHKPRQENANEVVCETFRNRRLEHAV